jgi:hypothetical protein
MIKTPLWMKFAEYPLYRLSRLFISRFDECWIPDYGQEPGLSGDLSHKYKLPGNARFIGPLSRFENLSAYSSTSQAGQKITAVISGPEPQRSIFEELLTRQLIEMDVPALIVGGKPEVTSTSNSGPKLEILPYLTTESLGKALLSASLVICRPGYTSVMDLQALGAKALFVPTPDQTEQEYLSRLYSKQQIALSRTQEKLNLATDIKEALHYAGFEKQTGVESYKTALETLQNK